MSDEDIDHEAEDDEAEAEPLTAEEMDKVDPASDEA